MRGARLNCQCPACEKECEFGEDAAGRVVQCPDCGEFFRAEVVESDERHCPKCNVDLAEGATVCMNCGFNMADGEYIRTTMSREREEPEGAMVLLNFVADLVPGLFKPFVLAAVIVCCIAGFAIHIMGMVLIGWKVVFSGIACAAFGLILYAQGIAMLLCGGFEVLSRASIDFESKHWYLFCLLVFGPFLAVILAMIYGAPTTVN